MGADLIRYDLLVQDALRSVVRKVLTDAARDGLRGEHHFNISFKTHAPGVGLPATIKQRYPDEMAIILQHEFWDLSVGTDHFEVSLNFSRKPERLTVPFDAITGFSDPSVPFGFKLEPRSTEAARPATQRPPPRPGARRESAEGARQGGSRAEAGRATPPTSRPRARPRSSPSTPSARSDGRGRQPAARPQATRAAGGGKPGRRAAGAVRPAEGGDAGAGSAARLGRARRSTATAATGPMSPEPTAFVKRSLSIAGHRTSLSLERAFWRRLEALAAARGLSLSALVAEVDAARGEANLSSALRVFALESAT